MWDGFNNPDAAYDEGSGSGSYIMFDDNVIRTAQVTDSEGSKIDHYAIEWIEIHQDNSVHAILSERKQVCHFPISTIATGFRTIGSPVAASLAQSCSPQKKVECGTCKYSEVWCLFRINYIQPRFRKLKRFGGLNWEAMKYISSLSITGSGANGPIGAGISFYNGPYFRPLTPNVAGAYNESALDSGNGMDVFGPIISNSIQIDNLKRSGQYDIKDTIAERIALLPRSAPGGSDDPCCSASDLEFTKGNCPKEPTNDWWIIPDCNCDRSGGDPGYGAGGPFGTELECNRSTPCGSSFRCVNGECSETYSGFYPTIEDCIVNCPYPRVTPGTTSSPPPTTPETTPATTPGTTPSTCETTITVYGNNSGWTDTGVDIPDGASVTITATGTVTWNQEGSTATPDGIGSGCLNHTGCSPMASECHVKLIGSIDDQPATCGSCFAVGSSYSGSQGPGRLYLRCNDRCVGDNGGSFSVTITTC